MIIHSNNKPPPSASAPARPLYFTGKRFGVAIFLFACALFGNFSLVDKQIRDRISNSYSTSNPAPTSTSQSNNADQQNKDRSPRHRSSSRPRIAILSSFVGSEMWNGAQRSYRDHTINKACYSHFWDYDFIFNQTPALTIHAQATNHTKSGGPFWLKFGCWERVAHLQAALPRYDWILYGDLDFIIKDFSRPIESFIHEFHRYGKHNVSVLVPADDNTSPITRPFSSFAMLIKNSPFGIKVLENWMQFGMGLCPNGNFPTENRGTDYDWVYGDQSGLWYALMKTHMEFYPNNHLPQSIVTCNETGFLNENPWLGFSDYFNKNGLKVGNYGSDLDKVPDNQPIIWSKSGGNSMTGLGVNNNFNKAGTARVLKHAFGVHWNQPSKEWDPIMKRELDLCKKIHGCTTGFRVVNNLTYASEVEVSCLGTNVV